MVYKPSRRYIYTQEKFYNSNNSFFNKYFKT